METVAYMRFSQTNTSDYSSNAYGSGTYGCTGTDCITTTATPGAPNTGFGIFPDLASASPLVLASLGIMFAVVVAGSALLVKKIMRKRKQSVKS